MPALTIKNIPDTLYNRLKESATANHRSINSELIHCLEQTLLPKRIDASEHLQRARELRRDIDPSVIDIDDIQNAINEGRP
ncbi:Arc family DNA-binding protein [Endozoicomonas sp. SCSIO W0465]|uniref:FitA-like ribbon-helix-helix domain-containing protein n=1 Tax=Endozoicomonas sp. SCSIO W0465 TaxID=2918516 RepID=UPI00207662B3|nr:Arc family DNA-binding protein [Endozoicomonas sp. SCSIO W0465]USE34122.1 Arc family DNA-binding protein [Endozoicomonas sp. SCSIO W0465]